jgi:hypothetical protein
MNLKAGSTNVNRTYQETLVCTRGSRNELRQEGFVQAFANHPVSNRVNEV